MFRLTLLFCLITSILFAQQSDEIVGKVKSVSENILFLNDSIGSYKFFSIDSEYGHGGFISPKIASKRFKGMWYNHCYVQYLNFKKIFNKTGTLKEEAWFYKDNSIVGKFEYTYDKNDSLIQSRRTDEYSKHVVVENMTYSNYNKLTTYLRYYPDDPNSFSFISNTFDDNGNIIKEDFFNPEGHSRSLIHKYNAKNKKIETKSHSFYIWAKRDEKSFYQKHDSIGETTSIKKYFYDLEDNLIEIQSATVPNTHETYVTTDKTNYKYNSKNKLIEETHVSDRKSTSSKSYEYNTDDLLSKTTYKYHPDPDNRYYEETEYFYKDNKIIRFTHIENKVSHEMSIDYKFDKKGNWIQQTKSVDGKPLYIWKRKIEYYKE